MLFQRRELDQVGLLHGPLEHEIAENQLHLRALERGELVGGRREFSITEGIVLATLNSAYASYCTGTKYHTRAVVMALTTVPSPIASVQRRRTAWSSSTGLALADRISGRRGGAGIQPAEGTAGKWLSIVANMPWPLPLRPLPPALLP